LNRFSEREVIAGVDGAVAVKVQVGLVVGIVVECGSGIESLSPLFTTAAKFVASPFGVVEGSPVSPKSRAKGLSSVCPTC